MPAPAIQSLSSSLMPETARDVQFALQSFSDQLGERLQNALSKQVGKTSAKLVAKDVEALGTLLKNQLPTMVVDAFLATLLADGDAQRRRRAVLGCLLHGVDLGGFQISRPKSVDELEALNAESADEDPEMTSEGAAKMLGVSRTHLNTLIEAGELGKVRRTSGGHRRISRSAVLIYWARTKERQFQGLDEMIEISQRLGLYDAEIDDLPDHLKPIP
jgi:excisionase family DNA binding protein